MNQGTLQKRITRRNSQGKLFVNKTRLTLFHQLKKLKTYQDTLLKNQRLWPSFYKIQVSTLLTTNTTLDGFYIEHGDTSIDEESIDRLWLVVRSLKNPEGKFDYKIKKFDTIKLGRVRFRVKDFKCE